jgi:hypothetical protein
MTFYRTCTGCILDRKPCGPRSEVRKVLAGLGVTSIKWKCRHRMPKVRVGDPVWVLTVDSKDGNYDEATQSEFPGYAVEEKGAKMVVFIENGAQDRTGCYEFDAGTNRGFCKIPFSRIERREGRPITICRFCGWPDFKGHQEGYSCDPNLSKFIGD